MLTTPSEGWGERIERVLKGLGHVAVDPKGPASDGEINGDVRRRLGVLLDAVCTWNRRHDLTAARSLDELVDLYLADALVLSRAAGAGAWVDVGSGGGAPGLTLAVLRPELWLTLVEPRVKRVAFLRSTVGLLELERTRVVRGRSQQQPPHGFDGAFSRATLPPPEWLAEGARLARREVWVLLAKAEPPSVDGWGATLRVDYALPLTGIPRRAVRYQRATESA